MRGWWSHVGGSEVSVSLSLHGSLHLLHHPQRNWERLQLVHPDVRTVPEHTQSSVTMATTDRHPCGDRGGDIVLTYIHHCETDPECPPRSAGRPDQTHTHTQMSHGLNKQLTQRNLLITSKQTPDETDSETQNTSHNSKGKKQVDTTLKHTHT